MVQDRLARCRWWAFAALALTYAIVAAWQIELLGVYLDAVNPDYLVVKFLNRLWLISNTGSSKISRMEY
jgi:hypothetical protein